MRKVLVTAVGAAVLAAVSLAAQAPSGTAKVGEIHAAARGRRPRDLAGVWSNNSVTPFERPKQWAGKDHITEAGARATEARYLAGVRRWRRCHLPERRRGRARAEAPHVVRREDRQLQSILDGRARHRHPHLAHHRSARRAPARAHRRCAAASPWPRPAGRRSDEGGPAGRGDGPEDRPLGERCITFGAPRTGAGYDGYFQFVQSPTTVGILQETIHDVRMVPIDKKPHLAPISGSGSATPRPLGRRHARRRDHELQGPLGSRTTRPTS